MARFASSSDDSQMTKLIASKNLLRALQSKHFSQWKCAEAAVSPHTKVLGLTPLAGLCDVRMFSRCLCGFSPVILLPPIILKNAYEFTRDSWDITE